MAVAGDVPGKFDVVINGQGYTCLRTLDGSYLSANRHRAEYTSTATFVERQNTSGAYGDDSQSFFLTASQNDWSEGENQRFFRANDKDSTSRYWLGSNIDITVPGQAMLRPTTTAVSFGSSVSGAAGQIGGSFYTSSTTNLFEVNPSTGAVTDRGAHGAGAVADALCTDGVYIYLSGVSCTSIRKYDPAAHTFAAFSATAAESMCFLNNTLFGFAAGVLSSYSTGGVAATVYTWKDAVGGTLPLYVSGVAFLRRLVAFGGKVVVQIPAPKNANGGELWIADTTGAQRIAEFPPNFLDGNIVQANGMVFVIGAESNGNFGARTVIYYLQNGTFGRLWASPKWLQSGNVAGLAIAKWQNGLIFTDLTDQAIRYYEFSTGGTSVIAPWTSPATAVYMASTSSTAIITQTDTNATVFTIAAAPATSGYVATSLMDFDNSLSKLMRGIKVDWTAGTGGNGGSVDIAYQVDSLDGAYTTLQASAVSGTEYTLSGVTGHSISVKVTLNKGTSTTGPILKRIYVRAAPQLQSYKVRTYNLDLTSTIEHPTKLEDGSHQPLVGFTQAQNLQTAITATAPFSVTDKFGTFTAVCEPANCSILELHSEGGTRTTPGQYTATIVVREV